MNKILLKKTFSDYNMKFIFFSLFLLLIFFSSNKSYAQVKITLKVNSISIEEFFSEVQNQSPYIFFYKDEILKNNLRVSTNLVDASISEILNQAFFNTDLKYTINEEQVSVFKKNTKNLISNFRVDGIVKDNYGNPLPGVSILEKGTTIGVSTDFDGKYSLKVKNPVDTLIVSNIGFKTVKLPIKNRAEINITLLENVEELKEVVVTALGIKREKKALGYSITEVKGEDLAQTTDNSFVNSLSGMVAGVSVSSGNTGVSGSSRVLIRGNAEIGGNNQPLYIVDGIPLDNSSLGSAGRNGGYDLGDGISSINPNDIESVSILKGPSSTALYGSRATNGVILITTKSGKGVKGFSVELNSAIDFITISRYYDSFQNKYGQGIDGEIPTSFQVSSATSISSWGGLLGQGDSIQIFDDSRRAYDFVPNNIQSFFNTGVSRTNDLVVSSGNEKRNIRLSLGNRLVDDIVPNSTLDRKTFSIRAMTKLGKKAEVDTKVTYINEIVGNRPALGDLPNNVGLSLFSLAPNLDQAWLQNYKDEDNNYREWNGDQFRINPYWSINETSNESTKNRIFGFLSFKYQFSDYFRVQASVGTDYYNFNFSEFLRWGTPFIPEGRMIERNSTVQETNLDFMARYSRRFLDRKLFILLSAGGNARTNSWKILENSGANQVILEPGLKAITNYRDNFISLLNPRKKVNGLFGLAHFSYDEKVHLDLTLRNDWSSTLPDDNNSYLYYSINSSFIFSDALNLKSEFFNYGKLRLSYSEVGGDTGAYQLNQTYNLQPFTHLGNSLGGIAQNFRPNPNLKPTRTKGFEAGLEFKLIKNRISLDATYYVQNTFDQILNIAVPNSAGYFGVVDNAGHIQNSGLELSLGTDILKSSKGLNWNINVNFTANDNKVIALHPNSPTQILAEARWAGALVASQEGGTYGAILGRTLVKDPDGNVIHNENGFPLVSDNVEVLGQGIHDWFGGLYNQFSYKNWSFNFLIDVKVGADLFSMTNSNAHLRGIHINTLEGREEWYAGTGGFVGKGVVNTGTEENPVYEENTKFVNPQLYWESLYNATPEPFIYDASYVKLRNINITYRFPQNVTGKFKLTGASLSLNAQNVWNIYNNVPNVDPESNYNNGNGQGFEYGSLPQRFYWGMSANIKF